MDCKLYIFLVLFFVSFSGVSIAEESDHETQKNPYVGMIWKDGKLVPPNERDIKDFKKADQPKHKNDEDWLDKVKVSCSIEWEDDFSMQKHCIKRQKEAYNKVNRFKDEKIGKNVVFEEVKDNPYARILKKCLVEWRGSSDQDWAMTDHCIKRQTKAYEDLYK